MNWKMKFCLACLVGAAMVIRAGNAHAQSNNWSGTNGPSWFDAANWEAPNQAPNGTFDPIVAGIPTLLQGATNTGIVFIGHQNIKGSGNPGEQPANSATAFPLSEGNTLGFGDYPVIGPGEIADATRLFFGGDTDGYDDTYLAKLTVNGGTIRVSGTGGADFFLGRSASNGDVPLLPATSPNVFLRIENGGKIQVGNISDPSINGGLLPSAASQLHWGQGTVNVEIDGAGSELNVSSTMRGTGRLSEGASPKASSGITISNGGLLEVGDFRFDRIDNAGFVNIVGSGSSLVAHAATLFNHDFGDGLNADHPALHGPGETVTNDDSTLAKLQHLIDQGIIVANGGAAAVLVTDLGGGSVQLTAPPGAGNDGDFDDDGNVDGADFLLWQRDMSVGSLADWQTNYGTTPGVAATSVVPEPSAGALLVIALAGFLPRRFKNQ